jgi:hypothetical protein
MVKTLIVSIFLSFVLVVGWAVDMVSYHEPEGLQPFQGDVFETALLRTDGR